MTSVITLFDVMLNNMIFFVLKDFDLSLEPLRVVLQCVQNELKKNSVTVLV